MRIVIGCLVVLMVSPAASAHQCILDGSSANAIQSYNACKLDLANGTAGHSAAVDATEDHAAVVARLQAENDLLKARLADVRRRLLGLLGDL